MKLAGRSYIAFISLILILLTCTYSVKANPTFAPEFCEFSVKIPSGARQTERNSRMPAPVVRGKSINISYPGYAVRAQCLHYENCNLSALTNEQKLATVYETAPKVFPLDQLAASTEQTDIGIVGRAEANTILDGETYLVRLRHYWGECTRLTLMFVTSRNGPRGLSDWINMVETVVRR